MGAKGVEPYLVTTGMGSSCNSEVKWKEINGKNQKTRVRSPAWLHKLLQVNKYNGREKKLQKLQKIAKFAKTDKICKNCKKSPKMPQIFKNCKKLQNCHKLSKMQKNANITNFQKKNFFSICLITWTRNGLNFLRCQI